MKRGKKKKLDRKQQEKDHTESEEEAIINPQEKTEEIKQRKDTTFKHFLQKIKEIIFSTDEFERKMWKIAKYTWNEIIMFLRNHINTDLFLRLFDSFKNG